MPKSQIRITFLVLLPVLLLLPPAPATGQPNVDWIRVHPYYRSVASGCICANGTFRMLVGDSLIALDRTGQPAWNLSWEEDNSIETIGRVFDQNCGVCFVDRLVDDKKLLIAYKYDSAKTFLWETELPLAGELYDLVTVDSDYKGNTYIVCDLRQRISDNKSPQSIEVFKLDAKGKVKWQVVDDEELATVRDPGVERRWTNDPLAYVDTTGVVTVAISDAQVFRIFRYKPNGARDWNQTSDPLGCTGSASAGPVADIVGLPTGDVVITTQGGTVRYDAAGGCDTTFEFPGLRLSNLAAQEYFAQQAGRPNDGLLRSNIRVYDKRGNLFIAWTVKESSAEDTYIEVSKYDPSLKQMWSKTYGENDRGTQSVNGIAVGSGLVVAYGTCYDQLGNSDGLILVYNEYGNLVLEKRYDSPEHVGDQITSALVDDKGNVYLYGISTLEAGGDQDAAFVLKLSNH